MCLARPGKVLEVKENSAILGYGEERREVGVEYLKPKEGEYVLVSGGQIIQKVDKKDLM